MHKTIPLQRGKPCQSIYSGHYNRKAGLPGQVPCGFPHFRALQHTADQSRLCSTSHWTVIQWRLSSPRWERSHYWL